MALIKAHRKYCQNQYNITLIKFNCDKCDYNTTDKTIVQRHVKSLHEEIRHDCDKCFFRATGKTNLQRHFESLHEEIHHDCDKSTLGQQTRQLIKDMSNHYMKRFIMIVRNATLGPNLQRHVESLHEEIHHECDKCYFMATGKTNLQRHFESLHEEIHHDCDKCDFRATDKTTVQRHVK